MLNRRKGTATGGAEILGAHVEGPFISVEKKGAHEQAVFKDAKNGIQAFDETYGSQLKKGGEAVSIITMAPEIEGVCDAIPDLVARGITVAMGHSACGIDQAEKAVSNGATSITHLFNAMQAVSSFSIFFCLRKKWKKKKKRKRRRKKTNFFFLYTTVSSS